jgi:hypothetical protein
MHGLKGDFPEHTCLFCTQGDGVSFDTGAVIPQARQDECGQRSHFELIVRAYYAAAVFH